MSRYRRSREQALLAGVCAGIAKQHHWNPWLLRAAWLVLAWVSIKIAVVAYLIAALVMPFERGSRPQQAAVEDQPKPRMAETSGERVRRLEKEFADLEARVRRH